MLTQMTRRQVLAVAGIALPVRQLLASAQVVSNTTAAGPGLPGLYRGKVVKVAHAGSIVDGKYQQGPIEAMMRRGMARARRLAVLGVVDQVADEAPAGDEPARLEDARDRDLRALLGELDSRHPGMGKQVLGTLLEHQHVVS